MNDQAPAYPKRLIEVDLPIARISAHARREKSIRHGHISTLHIWWARRPLAACRAVICAALWPDPADELCPPKFRQDAYRILLELRKAVLEGGLSPDQSAAVAPISRITEPRDDSDQIGLRRALLEFIAEYANWDLSTNRFFLATSAKLTLSAHEALGGELGSRPIVVDPFAGGGSIPLEALRVGADTFASDLNPLPVLLNTLSLTYIPKYRQELVTAVRKYGDWIKAQAAKELTQVYPPDPDGSTPIAYLWARTIKCEGPGCGAEIPLIRSLWLAKKSNHSVALQLIPNASHSRVDLQIIEKRRGWVDPTQPGVTITNPSFEGTVKRGSVTCPCCGYTTPVSRIREQLKVRNGGCDDARLLAVVTTHPSKASREFRLPTAKDFSALKIAEHRLATLRPESLNGISLVPGEVLPVMSGVFNAPIYGHNTWGSLFTPRQLLGLTTLARLVRDVVTEMPTTVPEDLKKATQLVLALGVSRIADISNSLCTWKASMVQAIHLFTRQAIPMMWDFTETSLLSDAAGDYGTTLGNMLRVLEGESNCFHEGHVERCSATNHPLPDDAADAFITDPPYYNAVPYADLSDFFYVWLKRMLAGTYPTLFATELSPKDDEACQMSGWDPVRYAHKDAKWFEVQMAKAMAEGRRVLRPEGIGVVVFAHKSTSGWEAQLQAMIDAGWVITGSWPIDTEMGNRLRAVGSAALASSVHLVCRPREDSDGSVRTSEIGDWRDVLEELPKRIHEWMPRLAREGVVGADAIFACLGPALEVFSRYSQVEKSNGELVTLREYLEHVWAAVSHEAITMIFKDADAAGLEPDARLTAMWLWTLSAPAGEAVGTDVEGQETDTGDEDEESGAQGSGSGFVLEFDAARKIAQGLGIHLERIPSVVEVKGDKASLLPVAERTKYLFGKDSAEAPTAKKKPKKKDTQLSLFAALQEADAAEAVESPELKAPQPGSTVLDRVHQAMILFAAGRGEALKRFLVEEGIGKDGRFWKLAQSLSALYPAGIDEKRWVDGVLARKKSLGL